MLCQQRQAGTFGSRSKRGGQCFGERLPAALVLALHDYLRAVGIVEVEYLGLCDGPGSPEAGRMVGIAFEFGGPALMALGQHALCVTAVGHCGREEEGLAWRDLVVLPDVGHYLLVCHGWPGTGRQTGKGHAGA